MHVVRDGGSFVRATLVLSQRSLELDIAHEPSAPLSPRDIVDGVTIDGLADLHANKLTCLLSRSEPRDLVDLFFLDQAGLSPESALSNALTKDAGIDPGVLSHLLRDFPTQPLPQMLCPFTEEALRAFRTDLVERFRQTALPSDR
jgi:hypothetical protein